MLLFNILDTIYDATRRLYHYVRQHPDQALALGLATLATNSVFGNKKFSVQETTNTQASSIPSVHTNSHSTIIAELTCVIAMSGNGPDQNLFKIHNCVQERVEVSSLIFGDGFKQSVSCSEYKETANANFKPYLATDKEAKVLQSPYAITENNAHFTIITDQNRVVVKMQETAVNKKGKVISDPMYIIGDSTKRIFSEASLCTHKQSDFKGTHVVANGGIFQHLYNEAKQSPGNLHTHWKQAQNEEQIQHSFQRARI